MAARAVALLLFWFFWAVHGLFSTAAASGDFASAVPAERVSLRLRRQPGGELRLNAGAIHGLTVHSVLAVYPPPGKAEGDQPLGYVRITGVEAMTSVVEPCEFEGLEARLDLPQGARCEVVLGDVGLDRLRVAVDDRDPAGLPVPEAQRARYEQLLRRASQQSGSLFEIVDRPSEAEWLVRPGGERVLLVPGSGWPHSDELGGPPVFEPDPAAGGAGRAGYRRQKLALFLGGFRPQRRLAVAPIMRTVTFPTFVRKPCTNSSNTPAI